WRRDDIFLEPQVAAGVGEGDPAVFHRQEKAGEGSLRRIQIVADPGFRMSTEQHGDSLPLRQAGIPRVLQGLAIFPIKVVIPDPDPQSVSLEMSTQPVARLAETFATDVLAGPAAKIEVAKSPLRDRDRVVLA